MENLRFVTITVHESPKILRLHRKKPPDVFSFHKPKM